MYISSTRFNKDVILGNLLKEVRKSKDNLLFAMLTNIKDYYVEDNDFVIVCDNIVNFQDLNLSKNLELFNNYIQKFDSNLQIKVQLKEDKSKELQAENVKRLKELFGNFVKFI